MRCGVLLQISHVAWSVCLFVSACVLGELCKNGLTDRNAVWGLSRVGPRDHVFDGVKIGRIHLHRGDKTVVRPFAKLLWTLVMAIAMSFIFVIFVACNGSSN